MAKTVAELKKAAEEAQAALAKAVEAEKQTKIAEMKKDIDLFGITAKELGFKLAADKDGKAPSARTQHPKVTYRDGKGNEWQGNIRNQGQRPQWIKDLIKTDAAGNKDYSAINALEVK